jgi:hypothetical protein
MRGHDSIVSPRASGLLRDPRDGSTRGVQLAWDAKRGLLLVTAEGFEQAVAGRSVRVATERAPGSLAGRPVHLAWANEGQSWLVTLTDQEAIRSLADLLSLALAEELRHAITVSLHSHRRGRVARVLVGLVGILAVITAVIAFVRHC